MSVMGSVVGAVFLTMMSSPFPATLERRTARLCFGMLNDVVLLLGQVNEPVTARDPLATAMSVVGLFGTVLNVSELPLETLFWMVMGDLLSVMMRACKVSHRALHDSSCREARWMSRLFCELESVLEALSA
ncbi:hypothetical protein HNV27_31260 [Myxococcus xanthus]|nr:hypothetical protein [Myxococcus xanthus]